MKKTLLCVFTFLALITLAASAHAYPSLYEVLNPEGNYDDTTLMNYKDIAAEAVSLTDTDGDSDDAVASMLLEAAGYADTNTFGIYGYSKSGGSITLGNTLKVFGGSDGAGFGSTIYFDTANGLASLDDDFGDTDNVDLGGTQFGFYSEVYGNDDTLDYTLYSHHLLNPDEQESALLFDTQSYNSGYSDIVGSDVVVAFEDLLKTDDSYDGDFNDLVVGISDVTPVPEPATMLLLGTGLLGVAAIGRKKYMKKNQAS